MQRNESIDIVDEHPSSRPEIHLRIRKERALHFLVNNTEYSGLIEIRSLGGRIKRPDLSTVPWLKDRSDDWVKEMIEGPLDLSVDGNHSWKLNQGKLSR